MPGKVKVSAPNLLAAKKKWELIKEPGTYWGFGADSTFKDWLQQQLFYIYIANDCIKMHFNCSKWNIYKQICQDVVVHLFPKLHTLYALIKNTPTEHYANQANMYKTLRTL